MKEKQNVHKINGKAVAMPMKTTKRTVSDRERERASVMRIEVSHQHLLYTYMYMYLHCFCFWLWSEQQFISFFFRSLPSNLTIANTIIMCDIFNQEDNNEWYYSWICVYLKYQFICIGHQTNSMHWTLNAV